MESEGNTRPNSAISTTDLDISSENVGLETQKCNVYVNFEVRERETRSAQFESDGFCGETQKCHVYMNYRGRDATGDQFDNESCRSESSLNLRSDGRATPDTHSLQPLVPIRKSFSPNRKKAAVIAVICVLLLTIVALTAVLASRKEDNSKYDNGNADNLKRTSNPTDEPTTMPATPTSTTVIRTGESTMKIITPSTTTTEIPIVFNPGTWMTWGSWSACSVSCATGVHVRYRSCNTMGENLSHCLGEYVHTDECSKVACPVYGSWTTWSSWGNCGVTCGGGQQSRTRTCTKISSSYNDCVGGDTQQQLCSAWHCVDCLRTCSNGSLLNDACDLCECNSTAVTGRVLASNSVPVTGARVYADSTLGKQVAVTDDQGVFTWNAFCPDFNITVSQDGFVTTTTMVSSVVLTITLEQIVLPYFSIEPQPKSRIVGENMTLCCKAEANPDILYYEWFRDDILLDPALYPNGTDIHLSGVTADDSGIYTCRANSRSGSAVTTPVHITVKDTYDAFCSDAYEQKRMHLPNDCIQPDTNTSSFEVGDCKPKSCRRMSAGNEDVSCRDSVPSCCGIADFDLVHVQCTGYKLSLLKVKACGCADCGNDVAKVIGHVKVYGSEAAVRYAKVSLNNGPIKYASSAGETTLLLSDGLGKAVITAKDLANPYKRTTKVIDVSEGTTGSIFTTMYVLDTTGTISIIPNVVNMFYIAKDPSDINSAIASVIVPTNAFVKDDYSMFTENVTIKVGFLDAKLVSDFDILPGSLMTIDSDGYEKELYTFGAFWVQFFSSDQTTAVLLNANLEVASIPNGPDPSANRVWNLNEQSGYWNQLRGGGTGNTIGQIQSTTLGGWYSIGSILQEESYCYFRVRIYESTDLVSEVSNVEYQIFQQSVHITDQGIFKTYGHTFSPSSSCFRTMCNGGEGYIELWTSNIIKASDEYLLATEASIHTDIGLTDNAQTTVNYLPSPDRVHLNLRFVVDSDGPFYENEARCLATSRMDNHFKFYFEDTIDEVYTFRYLFDLSSDVNRTSLQEISKRVWFQDRNTGIQACYIKVSVNMTHSQQIRVRAVSRGGTNPDITDEILGIRETFINKTETICLEYKCSGSIDVEYSTGMSDYTKVSIELDGSQLSCTVSDESEDLLDQPNGLNSPHIGDETFTFFAPRFDGPHLGVYFSTTNSRDIYSARSAAYGQCISGIPTDITSVNPNKGVAVQFHCK